MLFVCYVFIFFLFQGAVPATVAILDGQIHAGLSPDQLHDLATKDDCVKTSRRDFPYVLAKVGFSFPANRKTLCVYKYARNGIIQLTIRYFLF